MSGKCRENIVALLQDMENVCRVSRKSSLWEDNQGRTVWKSLWTSARIYDARRGRVWQCRQKGVHTNMNACPFLACPGARS